MKSIKKILSLFLTILLLVSATTPVMANGDITVVIDGKQIAFDVPPQLINNRTMVPLRAIFEALGATVDWDNDTQTVTSTKDGTTISMTINNPTMYVNGMVVTLDSPACLINDRTLVPVRAISEAFGTKVNWNETTSTVIITSTKTEYKTPTAYYTLSESLQKKGRAYSGSYVLSYSIDGVTIGMIYSENSGISLSMHSESGKKTLDTVLFLYENSVPVIINSTKVDESTYTFMGEYNTPKVSMVLSDIPALNEDIIKLSNAAYRTFDTVFALNNIDVKISDFGISYSEESSNTNEKVIQNTNNQPSNVEWYSSSMYKVGSDIPAGDYYAVVTDGDDNGYYCKYKDSSQKDIEGNGGFETFTFFRCYDGQYLKLSRCKITPIKNAPIYSSNNGVYDVGTYRVGIDMPAGEYKFTAKSDTDIGGYYCAYSDITYKHIDDNDGFDDVAYYTVKNGQYVELNRCTATRIEQNNITNDDVNKSNGSSNDIAYYDGYEGVPDFGAFAGVDVDLFKNSDGMWGYEVEKVAKSAGKYALTDYIDLLKKCGFNATLGTRKDCYRCYNKELGYTVGVDVDTASDGMKYITIMIY